MVNKPNFERQSHYENKYKKTGQSKNALFGEHFIYTNNETNTQIICKEKLYNDRTSLNRAIEDIKIKILNKHDYVLNLLDYSVEVQKNWCSTFYLLRAFYEYPEMSLKKMIVKRKKLSSMEGNFKSEELTHLLYHQVEANSYLQENKITHGDLTPSTIFRTNKGEFKLGFRSQSDMPPARKQMEKIMKKEPIYISPILFSSIKRREFDKIRHVAHKSDIYSLGLCILEAGLMKSIQGIYDSGDQIDQNLLDSYLDEFDMKYEDNPLLFTSVRKMLENDEEERADFLSLKEAMPDYKVICDYFYKVKHGLIDEEEYEGDSYGDISPTEGFSNQHQYNFAPNQNFEVPQNDFQRQKISQDFESQNNFPTDNNFDMNNQFDNAPNKVNSNPQQFNPQYSQKHSPVDNIQASPQQQIPTQNFDVKNEPVVQNNNNQKKEDYFDFFNEPLNNNPYFQQSKITSQNQLNQGYNKNTYSYVPQPQKPPITNYSYQPQTYNQKVKVQSNVRPISSTQTKVINGVLHKIVVEEIDELSPEGYLIKKQTSKYIPISNTNPQNLVTVSTTPNYKPIQQIQNHHPSISTPPQYLHNNIVQQSYTQKNIPKQPFGQVNVNQNSFSTYKTINQVNKTQSTMEPNYQYSTINNPKVIQTHNNQSLPVVRNQQYIKPL